MSVIKEKNQIDYSFYYSNWHDESSEHAEAMANSFVYQIQPYLDETQKTKALDIGCGMGFAMLGFQKLGFVDVLGIDRDTSQVQACHKRGLKVEQTADIIGFLSKQQDKFNVITLFDVLEHLPIDQQLPVLHAIQKSLSDDGVFLIRTPNANSPLASRWRYNDFTHYSSFTEHSLDFVLKNAGFNRIEIPVKHCVRPSFRFWKKSVRESFIHSLRRWLVHWGWSQVMKSELGKEIDLRRISFDLNLFAVVRK